ncbi:MAG: radical SAM protein [Deltaproteobacteria bacterium]|nr:radical SAM protein [Deltaproteobacteria bacterium]
MNLNPHLVIRPEARGALAFNPDNAETVYLDREGLSFIRDVLTRNFRSGGFPLSDFLSLRKSEILTDNGGLSGQAIGLIDSLLDSRIPEIQNSLSVPETLHLALTNTCDQVCAGCFYSKGKADADVFMSADLFERILDQAAEHRVFQFAFGGGEPLLHPRIADFVKKSRQRNVVPNITTNGNRLTLELARELKESGLGQIQISLDAADENLNGKTRPNHAAALRAVAACRKTGLRFGINALITRRNFRKLPALVTLCEKTGAAGINLLRPKPPVLASGWLEKVSLNSEDNLRFHDMLRKITRKNTIPVTLDQSLSFLAFHRAPDELYRSGVWGCGAGRRFLTIDPSGTVYPCSHFREPVGVDGDFILAWKSAATLDEFRNLEHNMNGHCRGCRMLNVCRGCRAVVKELGGDFVDPDPHCPLKVRR